MLRLPKSSEKEAARYIYCMLFGAIGDTIGFRNGIWEFAPKNPETSDIILYQFISLGGINNLDLSNWRVSDDTVMHMATAKALLSDYKDSKELVDNIAKEYVKSMNNMKNRIPGITTENSLEKIKNGTKWYNLPYDPNGGGSGGAMRTMCIGLAFYKEKDLDKLIATSIESGRITHNNAIGYLGAFVSALFTSFAIRQIDLDQWPFKLLELLNGDKIDDYIKKTKRDFTNYLKDKQLYIFKWEEYISLRFKDSKFISSFEKEMNHMIIPSARSKWYNDNFHLRKNFDPGADGLDSCIIAYDCLIDCNNSWEKLIVYSTLHAGDNDTTGSIAAALYGAYYGKESGFIPDTNAIYLEYNEDLLKLAVEIFKKYH